MRGMEPFVVAQRTRPVAQGRWSQEVRARKLMFYFIENGAHFFFADPWFLAAAAAVVD